LIDLALDQIFASLFQGGGVFGGIIGAIAGGGFAKGGYTGQGGKYEPAGVVHKGEYVFDKAAVDKIGVKNLEAIRRGMAGYADGGLVAPSLSRMAGGDRSTVMPAPVVNQTTRIVNTFDAASYLDEALNSPAGERILLNHIRSRPGAYKAVIST
jgi:phage-related minor tail protein